MDTRTLIDSITRQTTVLIAQLSTAAGIRAPLAHIADQVFVDLARELEAQGVRQKVVADMFGVALRTYQKKVQRLTESASGRDQTLWEGVVAFIGENKRTTRAAIQARFARERDQDVAAVLKDLTDSGLVYATGHGRSTVYGVTSELDRQALRDELERSSADGFVWLLLFRNGPMLPDELAQALPYGRAAIDRALADLLGDGRVREDGQGRFAADQFLVPVGAEQGWEAAVFDHFQAMVQAITAKVRAGLPRSGHDDTVGGATLGFEVCPQHPLRDEVLGQLRQVRRQVNDLWERVEAHNERHPIPSDRAERVSFYFGQHVTEAARERGDVE